MAPPKWKQEAIPLDEAPAAAPSWRSQAIPLDEPPAAETPVAPDLLPGQRPLPEGWKLVKQLPGEGRLVQAPDGQQVLIAPGFTADGKRLQRYLKPLEQAEKNRAEAARLRKNALETKQLSSAVRGAPTREPVLFDEAAAAALEKKANQQEAIFAAMMRRDAAQTMGAEFAMDKPLVAGALQFLSGLPAAGGWIDEMLGKATQTQAQKEAGISQTDVVRGAMEATRQEAPLVSLGEQMLGGVAGMFATPGLLKAITPRGPTSAAQVASGVVRGGTVGGAEGAISGAGRAEEGDRASGAVMGGAVGTGLGALFGPLSPAGEKAWANIHTFALNASDKELAKELGTSTEVAGFLRQALQNEDFAQAQAVLSRAGDKAMLADASRKLAEYLDVAITSGGAAGPAARRAVTERVSVSSREFQDYMDQALGIPEGRGKVTAEIRQASAPQREQVYEAAYGKPIDYSAESGRKIEAMMRRVPASAIRQAQNQMKVDGVESRQVLADIAQDGTVTFRRMPDVRELDYIRRALNDVAQGSEGVGAMGGKTQYGASLEKLSIQLREAMADSVPEYRVALKTAASTIDEVRAANLGYDALSPATKPEEIRTMLAGMTDPERRAAKLGLRNAIEDRLADVQRSASNSDRDAAEFRKLLNSVSSRAFENKLTVIMGDRAAKEFLTRLDQEVVSLELMAAIAANSKTQARQELTAGVRAYTAPGILETLQQGEPLRANKMLVQVLTGKTEAAQKAREAGIFDEIATVLTQRRGQDAQLALKIIEKAAKGQQISQKSAAFAARTILRPASVVGYQGTTQTLRYNPETGEVE